MFLNNTVMHDTPELPENNMASLGVTSVEVTNKSLCSVARKHLQCVASIYSTRVVKLIMFTDLQ